MTSSKRAKYRLQRIKANDRLVILCKKNNISITERQIRKINRSGILESCKNESETVDTVKQYLSCII